MQNFPLRLPNGNVVLHLVPPQHRLTIGEFFYQVRLVIVFFNVYYTNNTC